MKYFAYGSNMSLLRLQKRVPSATRIGKFSLPEHQLRFHKSSLDGSGKCDAFQTGDVTDLVIGSLFEMNDDEKNYLDLAEGLGCGYDEKIVNVKNELGENFDALIYFATKVDPTLKPYSWYLNHVIIGAKETNVSIPYLRKIDSISYIEDPDLQRDNEERKIYK